MRVRGFLCGGVRMRRLRGNPFFVGGRDGISALIVEGDLPGSLAISPHGTPRPGILWTVSRSYPVSLPWVLGTALAAPFPPFPDMASSDLPGPADPALRVSDSQIYPYMCG